MSGKTIKASLVQAEILGRVERLAGNSIKSNPYSEGSERWVAFNNGWNRKLDDPLIDSIRKSKQESESC